MNIENHVVSFKLVKRLKEPGVKRKSIFYWIDDPEANAQIIDFGQAFKNENFAYPAYLASELGEILPSGSFYKRKVDDCYALFYRNDGDIMDLKFLDYNETNARAKLLIYLLEQQIIKFEDINALE